MRARAHTRSMLTWWRDTGVDRADLAVKQPSGKMLWHRDLALASLPLAWARAQNVRRAEVYVRPARGYAWPVVFLDDVATSQARAVARKYEALVVETSPAGGCHIWLACEQPLLEVSRRRAQRWLAQRIAADLGSVSGEHLGRLAGFKNWKRRGPWVNVLVASRHARRWDPGAVPASTKKADNKGPTSENSGTCDSPRRHTDTSPSGQEWGWVCGQLEAGCPPDRVYTQLLETAHARRGLDVERYARRTLARALERTATARRERTEVRLLKV